MWGQTLGLISSRLLYRAQMDVCEALSIAQHTNYTEQTVMQLTIGFQSAEITEGTMWGQTLSLTSSRLLYRAQVHVC